MSLSRRGLLGAFLAAPAIIRTPGLLMPVRPVLIDASQMHGFYGEGAVTASIEDVERKNREFWGLTPVTIYTNLVQTGRCVPDGTVWTNTEGTLRKGLNPLSAEQLRTSEVYYSKVNRAFRAFVEAVFDRNGKPYLGERVTPFCADIAEAERRVSMARDTLHAARYTAA